MAKKKKQIKITQKKSIVGATKKQKQTIRALGLRKNYQSIVQNDTPAIQGMINRVQHLVEVEEV